MTATTDLAVRLSQASTRKIYDVYSRFDWDQRLDDSLWCMSPELVSLHGTETWETLDPAGRHRLSFHELVAFFSFVLHGERPLLEGMSHRLYERGTPDEISEYMHHFLDEENKHMVMFATFCRRYAGKIYPEKKITFAREYAPGEEDIAFFAKVLVVEELGDYYNVVLSRDERVHPIVREINLQHHIDEARHIVFGRSHLADLWARHSRDWSAETLASFRDWLGEYVRSSWRDFYNPSVYRDAGIPEPFEVRRAALASPACRSHRERASKKLLDYFREVGMLTGELAL